MKIITNGDINQSEIDASVKMLREKFPNKTIDSLTLTANGEYVDINYLVMPMPFDRIRRITGYLVGTLDRFNNAKAAEEHDRVKHGISL